MNSLEWRSTAALSAVQALRMIGMFMILPVFALYARSLPGEVTQLQVGLVIGLYGLVQAVLQIPFGIASDRIGRKPVMTLGLLLFAAGSFVAGSTNDIHTIMLGRALQGCGAISGAASALLADVTRLQIRTQAMAIFGAGMGLSFILALVLGPVVDGWIGVNGIFNMTGVLSLAAIPMVWLAIPSVPRTPAARGGFAAVLADRQLLRLDAGIFLLHTMMTCLFVAAPQAIVTTLGLDSQHHWQVYLPILLVSIVLVFPAIRRIERSGNAKPAFIGAVALLGVALALAADGWHHEPSLLLALLLFFIAFNYLEASLPSLISRRAPPQRKGAALGIYSSSQFLGGFAGGSLGGFASGHYGLGGAFAAAALLALPWLAIAAGLTPPATEVQADGQADGEPATSSSAHR